MYTLNQISCFHVTDPANTYNYDIVPVAGGVVSISSDDTLRLLDPLALNGPAVSSVKKVNADVTCLKAVGDENALIVVTAGRDGKVCLLDPRSCGKIGEVRSGKFFCVFEGYKPDWCYLRAHSFNSSTCILFHAA